MEFQKPSESLALQALLNNLTTANFSIEGLRRLLWLINAHPKLIGFSQIAENLEHIFTCEPFRTLDLVEHKWAKDVPSWINILKWINKNHQALFANPELNDFFRVPKKGDKRHPMAREGMIRHGLYTSLWNRHESGAGTLLGTALSKQYQSLQAQLLIAVINARAKYSTLDFYESYNGVSDKPDKPILSYPSTLVLREMSQAHYSALLEKLNPETSFNGFHMHLQELVLQHTAILGISPILVTDFIKKIASYIAGVVDDIGLNKTARSPRKKGGKHGGGGKIRHGFVNINEYAFRQQVDPSLFGLDSDLGEVEVVFVRDDTDEDENERERGGESPTENARPSIALYDMSKYKGAIIRAKYGERIQTTAAQRFPWDYNQLTFTELEWLHNRLSSVWEDFLVCQYLKQKELDLVQGSLIVETMLWLGQSLESARSLYLRNSESAAINEFALLVKMDDLGRKIVHGWRLPALRPHYKTQLDDKLQAFNRPMQDAFFVPDVTGLGAKILYYLEKTERKHERVFSAESKTARQMFNAIVKDKSEEKRVAQGRIARVISNEIMRITGDQTLAWCVTADMARRNEPRMFYTVYPASKLVATYKSALGNLEPKLKAGEFNPTLHTESTGYIGARFVATIDSVAGCIKSLKQHLIVGVSNPNSLLERIQYHNHYTIYTWLMQAFGSTLRAVNNPTEILGQWNKAKDVASVSLADKENVFRDRARLIFLSEQLQTQLDHYLDHRDFLINNMGIQSDVARLKEEADLLFSLNVEKGALAVTKTWVEGQFAQLGFPFPGNFHRGFIRSELLQSECPPQVIDAFLGHANQGESVVDAFSAFDYNEYRKELAWHLGKILQQLKLVPIWSRLIPH